MIFYLFFLVLILIFSSFQIGSITARVWAVIIMFFFLLYMSSKSKLFKKNVHAYITIFGVYIFLLFIAMNMNGDAELYGLKWIFANHFVSIVVFAATYHFIKSAPPRKMDFVFMTFACLLIIDAIVTITQYYNNPIGWAINMFITQGRDEGTVEFIGSRLYFDYNLSGMAMTNGLFSDVVINAIFLGSFGVLPFYFFQRDSKVYKIIAVVTIILSLIACFMCQERAAMLTFLASVVFLSYKSFHRESFYSLIAVMAILLMIFDFSRIDYGRFQEVGMFSNDSRISIWESFLPFFSDNWLWGGVKHFMSLTEELPHNYVFNAFVFAGLLGGVTIIILLLLTLVKIFKIVFSKSSTRTSTIIAIALLSILAQSFVHNISFVTGDVFSFLLLSMMVSTDEVKDRRINVNYKIIKERIKQKAN